jgi:hypothetical protein
LLPAVERVSRWASEGFAGSLANSHRWVSLDLQREITVNTAPLLGHSD